MPFPTQSATRKVAGTACSWEATICALALALPLTCFVSLGESLAFSELLLFVSEMRHWVTESLKALSNSETLTPGIQWGLPVCSGLHKPAVYLGRRGSLRRIS